ncbi:MAG: HAD family phosphatase [Kiritimatiellales bacterium]|nr:HAD family phosphatase [Kiritimatiellales bacterium]
MKYFLFDIGKVLVNFDLQGLLQAIADGSGQPLMPQSERDLAMHAAVESGRISDEEFVQYLNGAKGLSWTVDDLTGIWSGMFSINETGYRLYNDALQSGVPACMFSNLAQHHVDAIEHNWPGFFTKAASLFFSYQLGLSKPDPAIYQRVLADLGTEADQCFFIDDRPENIEAAQAAGISAHRFIPENHIAIRKAAAEFFEFS